MYLYTASSIQPTNQTTIQPETPQNVPLNSQQNAIQKLKPPHLYHYPKYLYKARSIQFTK
jgi:hypothetical protein